MDATTLINNCLVEFVKNKIDFAPNGHLVDVEKLNSIDSDDLYYRFFYDVLIYGEYSNALIRLNVEELRRFNKSIVHKMNDVIAREYYYTKIQNLEGIDRDMAKALFDERFFDYYNPEIKFKISNKRIYIPHTFKK